MTRDYITTSILKEIRKNMKEEGFLKKFPRDSKLISKMSVDEVLSLINFIVDTQTKCVRLAFENKDSIKLDYIGTFKVSELREFDLNFTKKYREDNPTAKDSELLDAKRQAIKNFYLNKPKIDKKVFQYFHLLY